MTMQTRDDVLYAFAVEPAHDRETLDRYLRDHPDFALDLLDLSSQLSRTDRPGAAVAPLDDADEALVSAAWSRRVARSPRPAENPFARLDAAGRRAFAGDLGLKVQVVSLFREGRIAVDTVPRRLLALMAERFGTDVAALARDLAVPAPALARAYKSDDRPTSGGRVAFSRALAESGATPEAIAALMADD